MFHCSVLNLFHVLKRPANHLLPRVFVHYALTVCPGGGYVNFGVFALYGDKALDSALETVLQLALHVRATQFNTSDQIPHTAPAISALTKLLESSISQELKMVNACKVHSARATEHFAICSRLHSRYSILEHPRTLCDSNRAVLLVISDCAHNGTQRVY